MLTLRAIHFLNFKQNRRVNRMREYEQDEEPYCTNCGAEYDDLAAIACPANCTVYECKICGHEDIWSLNDKTGE